MNKMDKLQYAFQVAFGANVKRLREKRGLSLRQLAANCNIDNSHISKMEQGLVNVTLATILELSKGLEVQPVDLLNFEW